MNTWTITLKYLANGELVIKVIINKLSLVIPLKGTIAGCHVPYSMLGFEASQLTVLTLVVRMSKNKFLEVGL